MALKTGGEWEVMVDLRDGRKMGEKGKDYIRSERKTKKLRNNIGP